MGGVDLPAVVNDEVGADGEVFGASEVVGGVGEKVGGGVGAVGAVPIVVAVDGFFREAGIGAHQAAELAAGLPRGLAGVSGGCRAGGNGEVASAAFGADGWRLG